MKRCVHAVKLAMTVMLSAFLFLSVQDLGYIHAADKKIVLLKLASKENYDTIQAAIDAVAAGEDAIIQIPAGTYSEPLKISNTSSRTIILKGASADVSAYSNGGVRSSEETILTGGIEVNGLLEDDSLEINGLDVYKRQGLGEQRATHAIRISLSHLTTREEVDAFLQALKEINHDYRTK